MKIDLGEPENRRFVRYSLGEDSPSFEIVADGAPPDRQIIYVLDEEGGDRFCVEHEIGEDGGKSKVLRKMVVRGPKDDP